MHLSPYYEQHYNRTAVLIGVQQTRFSFIASTVYLSICNRNGSVSCINWKTFQNGNANKMEYQNDYIFDVKVKTYE